MARNAAQSTFEAKKEFLEGVDERLRCSKAVGRLSGSRGSHQPL